MNECEKLIGIYKNKIYDFIIRIAGSDDYYVCIAKDACNLHFVKNMEKKAQEDEVSVYLGGTALCLPVDWINEYFDLTLGQAALNSDEWFEATEIIKEHEDIESDNACKP